MNDSFQRPAPPVAADPRVRRYALIALACALLLALWGIIARLNARSALAHQAAEAAVVTVVTVKPTLGPGSSKLVLPGTVQHGFTHFRIELALMAGTTAEPIDGIWARPDQFRDYAFPTLTKKLVSHALSALSRQLRP